MILFNIKIRSAIFILLGGIIMSCEDPIEVPSDFSDAQLVVDAWITNESKPQTIRLSQSIDYFEGGEAPNVSGATVQVCNGRSGACFMFEEEANGIYTWTPQGQERLGVVGDNYTLTIAVAGRSYLGSTATNRTTRIDSIALNREEGSIFFEEGIYAQLYAFDSVGYGDTYWIRAYKNGALLNRPVENVIAWDATFDGGTGLDGSYFIVPIRASINEIDDEGATVPYQPGDEIYVEVHSISREAFTFLNIAFEQILNEGIFAVPLANAVGNIADVETGEKVLGIFNIAQVHSMSRTVE
ncbi:MAG: DUF4249 domain-containing protein [Saprospiraceae bacterium]|nr:DUF4249 domain-containing protein [Saprospiraceae bacterium]